MLVKVRSLTGQTHDVNLPEVATVSQLKEQIQSVLGIPPDVQRLIFMGRELVDGGGELAKFNVVDGSVVHLVIRSNNIVAAAPEEGEQVRQPDVERPPAYIFNNPAVPMGFLSDRVFQTFRLTRFIQILTIIDLIQILFFGIVYPFVLVFALFPMSGFYAANKLRPMWIIPYVLFQLITIGFQIYIFTANGFVTFFGILNIIVDIWVIYYCSRFLMHVRLLTEDERQQLDQLRNPDRASGLHAYW